MQDKVSYKTSADHFLHGFSKGIPIRKWHKKFTIYSPNHLKNALSAAGPLPKKEDEEEKESEEDIWTLTNDWMTTNYHQNDSYVVAIWAATVTDPI